MHTCMWAGLQSQSVAWLKPPPPLPADSRPLMQCAYTAHRRWSNIYLAPSPIILDPPLPIQSQCFLYNDYSPDMAGEMFRGTRRSTLYCWLYITITSYNQISIPIDIDINIDICYDHMLDNIPARWPHIHVTICTYWNTVIKQLAFYRVGLHRQ